MIIASARDMERYVEPEWLDALPADAPAAIGSRRDLRRLKPRSSSSTPAREGEVPSPALLETASWRYLNERGGESGIISFYRV